MVSFTVLIFLLSMIFIVLTQYSIINRNNKQIKLLQEIVDSLKKENKD
jgi:preprotein translocase subunit YajC